MKLPDLKSKDNKFAYLLCLPVFLYLMLVMLVPICWAVYYSMTNKTIGGSGSFIGLENFRYLAGNRNFLMAVKNTVIYTAFAITGKTILGTIMALCLNMEFKGRNIVRAVLIIPWTLPNIIAVLNWKWIFSETGGILSYILKTIGIVDHDIYWFGTAGLAMFSVIVVNIWRGVPFFGISILSQLQTIPKDYYEAAEIDGASVIQRFWHITFPLIKNIIILTAMVSTIWTINEFESVWLLTGGGPSGATELLNIFSYKTAMTSSMLGRGVAVSVFVIPIFIVLIYIISNRMLKDENKGASRQTGKKRRQVKEQGGRKDEEK